jgi:type I restriction-modification system DNA methylase subunit
MSEKLDSGKMLICELCKKSFKQKCDYDKHKNAKRPCIPMTEIQKITQMKDVSNDNKSKLTSIFKNCLNILRDNEGLIGEKGLRTLSHLLILKLIEKHFGNEINIDEYEYDFNIHDHLVDNHRKNLLKIVRFSKLIEEEEDDIPELMKYLWDDILSKHPATEKIFKKGKSFDIQHKSTYKRIFHQLNSPELSNTEYDVLGNSYEEVIQDIMTGKVLGQFFTQPLVKKMMVKLINPQIYPDGKIDTCGDPTMGTGGFLITYLQYILHQASVKNIKPNWDFIKTEGLYGKELESDTYQLAVSNMLISTGHMFEQLDRGDSIREPITRKFDNILANPPFGIKGLKYDDFQSSLKLEYVPIKSDNAVSLFIQAIIYMLNIGGKCAVVLPDGQDLFSKTNKTLVAVREYLMKTCDLKEIIYLPSGIFTYTSIKTCVFYFVKKREGSDVIEVNINVSKTQKETGRDYKFSKTHQTTKVAFYDYNPYEGEGVKNLLVEVHIEKIVSNSYSLNYAEYIKDETEEEQYEEGVVVKTLGEVCEFQNGSQLDKKDMVEGNIPIFGGGFKIVGFHNANNRNGNETIVCGTGAYSGYVNHNYGNQFWASQCFTMKSKNINIMIDKYLYYYSKIILEPQFMSNQKGTAIPFIRYTQVIGVKIHIPSHERQQEIVKYLDFVYEKANKTSNEKIAELKQLNEFCLNNQKMFGENIVKTLGEVCSIDYGTRIVKGNNTEGEYPVYGSGRAMFSTNTFNREGYNILIGRFALSLECVRFINEKIFLNDSGLSIKPKTDILLHKYIGYYLLHNQSIIYNCARGTAQKNLEMDIFKSIKIPIPSLEHQKEIVEYCEANELLIQKLEMEIENNKKQAQQFIDGIVKSKSISLEECETQSSSSTESSPSEDENVIVVAPKSSSKAKSCRLIKSL